MKKFFGFVLVLMMALCFGWHNMALAQNVQIGDLLKFGHFGGQEIEWQVLEIKDGQALLLSKYGLQVKVYNQGYSPISWESCFLRKWLNDGFYNRAFGHDEQQKIVLSSVTADKNPILYNAYQGNDMQDKVFLLSILEVQRYFANDEARKCRATEFAKQHGAEVSKDNGCSIWWLRSIGNGRNCAAYVDDAGSVNVGGGAVSYDRFVVRPAIRVDLNKM